MVMKMLGITMEMLRASPDMALQHLKICKRNNLCIENNLLKDSFVSSPPLPYSCPIGDIFN